MIIIDKIRQFRVFLGNNSGSLKHKTIRSGVWVGITSIILNLLTIVKTIILARLLTPEIFGLMGIYLIVLRGIEIFTETGFSAALIHRQNDFEKAKDTAFTLMVLRGIVLSIIVFVIAPFIAAYYDRAVLDWVLKLLAVSFIFTGLRNINITVHQKELNFRSISYLEQAASAINLVVVIALAYLMRSIWALAAAHVIMSIASAVLSYVIVPGKPKFALDWKIARELFSYGKYITALSVVMFIASEIDDAIIGKILGMEYLGYYVLAYSIANLPTTHISKVISRVMFSAYSQLQNDYKTLGEAYLKTLKLISALAIPTSVGLAILAPDIITIFYGSKWAPAAIPVQILCAYGIARAITASGGYLFNAIGKPNIPFYMSAVMLIAVLVLIYPLTSKYQLEGASWAVTIPMLLHLFAALFVLSRAVNLNGFRIFKTLAFPTLCSLLMGLAMLYAKNSLVVTDGIYKLLLLVALGITVYSVLNIRFISAQIRRFAKA